LKLIFLGTGTSQGVPVIGCNCDACSSIDPADKRFRCSVLIENEFQTKFLIDIGADFRQQMIQNKLSDVDVVLLTHEHNDHVAGLDDIRTINFLHNKDIPVYSIKRVIDNIKKRFEYIFSDVPYPGLPRIELNTITSDDISISNQSINIIEVMHGSLPIIGFRLGDVAYITDASSIETKSLDKLKDLKVLVLNALRREPHYSHFTLDEAISVAKQINAETTYLTHISHKMGPANKLINELPDRIKLAYDGLILEI